MNPGSLSCFKHLNEGHLWGDSRATIETTCFFLVSLWLTQNELLQDVTCTYLWRKYTSWDISHNLLQHENLTKFCDWATHFENIYVTKLASSLPPKTSPRGIGELGEGWHLATFSIGELISIHRQQQFLVDLGLEWEAGCQFKESTKKHHGGRILEIPNPTNLWQWYVYIKFTCEGMYSN